MLKKSVPRYLLLGICCVLLWQLFPTENILGNENKIEKSTDQKQPYITFEFAIKEKINAKRTANGLRPLTINDMLIETAREKSKDMIKNNYFSHTDKNGDFIWKQIEQNGYRYKYAGENLARNFSNADAIINAWMQSESHRKNILNENFKEVGIGVAKITQDNRDYFYITAIFGTKKSSIFNK